MNEFQEKYFELKYKNRILQSIKNQEVVKKEICLKRIKEGKEAYNFFKELEKENYDKNKVTKNFIKEKMLKVFENENIKNLLIELELFFKPYSDLYKEYYNPERNMLFLDHNDLLKWYKEQDNKCGYCGISKAELEKIAKKRGQMQGLDKKCLTLNGKKKRSLGTLEIERLNSATNNYIFDNVILACPLCNNAKSNLINEADWHKFFVPAMKEYYNSLLKDC